MQRTREWRTRLGLVKSPQQQLRVDEQCRSGTPLGRLPSQPIFKLPTCEGSSAGPPLGQSEEEPTQRLCKECGGFPTPLPPRREGAAEMWCFPPRAVQPRGMLRASGLENAGTREELILGPSSLGFLRAFTGKQYRRCGVLRERAWEVQVLTLSEPRLRMLLAGDSGTVVMKVDIRPGVCNNSPAQASSSENE